MSMVRAGCRPLTYINGVIWLIFPWISSIFVLVFCLDSTVLIESLLFNSRFRFPSFDATAGLGFFRTAPMIKSVVDDDSS